MEGEKSAGLGRATGGDEKRTKNEEKIKKWEYTKNEKARCEEKYN
jgi:hypothetical protein